MIAQSPGPVEEPLLQNQSLSWQEELSGAIRAPQALLRSLQLSDDLLPAAEAAARLFPLRVPRPYLARIEPGNPRDPLLLQVLPLHAEQLEVPGFVPDPLQEQVSLRQPGVLHKYQGRVLLIVSGACAINCRYCFRRHFPYQDNNLGRDEWQQSLSYIAANPDIEEVILSGGDPLVASDKRLAWLLSEIEAIPHVQRLRIHTRLPIVIPQRITPALLTLLQNTRLQTLMVIHANHPRELDQAVRDALQSLRASGILLLNQSVLLRDINDSADTLAELSKALFAAGVLPYYLHLLDPVAGTAHFDVDENRAQKILQELRASLSGYLVPKLVREEAGEPSKTPIPF